MAQMGRYCKAYLVGRLREFGGWSENTENLRRERSDGKEIEAPRKLTESDFLYLQENFTITDGIFIDENIVFQQVTPEWIGFCKEVLKFAVPPDQQSVE